MERFKDEIFSWIAIAICVLGGLGWGLNVVKLIRLDFQSPYKAEFVRIIGLTPLGAIIGYMHLED